MMSNLILVCITSQAYYIVPVYFGTLFIILFAFVCLVGFYLFIYLID